MMALVCLALCSCNPAAGDTGKNGVLTGHISIEGDTLYVDEVEWITTENAERMQELNLAESDMPNGYYIHNPSTDKITFQISESMEYHFVALESLSFFKEGEDRNYSTTKKEEFMEFLNSVDAERVVFTVEIKDGVAVKITEIFTN